MMLAAAASLKTNQWLCNFSWRNWLNQLLNYLRFQTNTTWQRCRSIASFCLLAGFNFGIIHHHLSF
jgi:hypothetical protein